MSQENKEIIEKIEVIINRYSPMENFKIKEDCAKDIHKEIDIIIEKRLRQLGIRIGKCKKCGKEIFWIETGNHKRSPVCLNLINHFADCPFASDFRKNVS